MAAGFISLRSWNEYQHYKDRDPLWVKVHQKILTTEAWLLGTNTTRLVQLASILIAARYSNQIPRNWALILKVTHLDLSEQELGEAIEALVGFGFMEFVHSAQEVILSASALLAEGSDNRISTLAKRSSEKRREEKIKKESKTPNPTLPRGEHAKRKPKPTPRSEKTNPRALTKKAEETAEFNRLDAWGESIDCPLERRDVDTPLTWESRIQTWITQTGKGRGSSKGPRPVADLAKAREEQLRVNALRLEQQELEALVAMADELNCPLRPNPGETADHYEDRVNRWQTSAPMKMPGGGVV